VFSLQNDDQVSSAFKKAMIQVAGDRDMAAQETALMLLSLPLVGCTFSFVTISLDKTRKVNIDTENEGDEVLQKSALQEYAERTKLKSRYTGLSQLNLMQYVSQYRKVRIELTKRANPYIVRTFPKISAIPAGPDFRKYCKYQLIKFKPWERQPSNAWSNWDESDQMFINAYELFLMTDEFAEENMFRYFDETDRIHDTQCGQTFGNVVKTIQVTIKMMTTKVKLTLMTRRKSMIGCCYAELTKIMVKQVIRCQTMKQWIGLEW
jgi:Fe-S cluster biosynthesis and repair protein YggX